CTSVRRIERERAAQLALCPGQVPRAEGGRSILDPMLGHLTLQTGGIGVDTEDVEPSCLRLGDAATLAGDVAQELACRVAPGMFGEVAPDPRLCLFERALSQVDAGERLGTETRGIDAGRLAEFLQCLLRLARD